MNSGLEIRGLEEFMDTDISCHNIYVKLKTEMLSDHKCITLNNNITYTNIPLKNKMNALKDQNQINLMPYV